MAVKSIKEQVILKRKNMNKTADFTEIYSYIEDNNLDGVLSVGIKDTLENQATMAISNNNYFINYQRCLKKTLILIKYKIIYIKLVVKFFSLKILIYFI